MILDNMHFDHSFDGMMVHDHLMVNWMFGYYMFFWLTIDILLILTWISSNFDDEGGEVMYFEYEDI